jgi:hypothetical protein
MLEKLQISSSSCPIYDKPSIKSNLETEGLFGELFFVKEKRSNWYYGFLETDKYHGWLHKNNLEHPLDTNYKVISVRSIVLSQPDVKSKSLFYIPICSLIHVNKLTDKWAQICFKKKEYIQFGYLPKSHISKIGSQKINWKQIALNLTNIPYKWGGRDTLSIDCSSYIQLICNTQNIYLPRNANEQFSFLKKVYKSIVLYPKLDDGEYDSKYFEKGCLVYWERHVGILIDNNIILHANAFHNQVQSENIKFTVDRLLKENLKIKLICSLFKTVK